MISRLGFAALVLALAPHLAHAQATGGDDDAPDVAPQPIEEPVAEEAVAEEAVAEEPVVEEPVAEEAVAEEPREEPAEEEPASAEPAGAEPSTGIADELRQREEVRPWHVAFGTATGFATYATTILGFITFNDRYGWSGDAADTGCASGSAIFGAAACNDPPLSHLISASTASTLFTVTFALSLFMPDPLHVDEGGGEQATLLTIHKTLRWGLLGLFVTQLVLGTITAAAGISDFGTRRDLAVAHLSIGTLTNVVMTTQGVLGSIMEW